MHYGRLCHSAPCSQIVWVGCSWDSRWRRLLGSPPIPVEWRLGLTTGFLGGLTTFSTFSAEAIGLLQAGHYPALLLHVGSHVLASLTLTWCGLKLGQWLWA